MRFLPAALTLALLAGCATPRTVAPAAPAVAPPLVTLAELVGATPQQVVRLLGSPSLDRTEGRGRQLQFTQGACVLDLFFYPPSGGGEPVARHAEARFKDGRPLDAGSCLQSQQRATAAVS